jgi:hypothetical protein
MSSHGARGSLVGWGTAISRDVVGSIPDEVTIILKFNYSFQPQYGPGVDLASNKNEYQEDSCTGGGRLKGGHRWQSYRHLWADYLEQRFSIFLKPSTSKMSRTVLRATKLCGPNF